MKKLLYAATAVIGICVACEVDGMNKSPNMSYCTKSGEFAVTKLADVNVVVLRGMSPESLALIGHLSQIYQDYMMAHTPSPDVVAFKKTAQLPIDRWSHLVPDGEIKTRIKRLIPLVLSDKTKMTELIKLTCESENMEYASYASLTFTDFYASNESDECCKYGGMLAHIRDRRSSSGGNPVQASLFWECYAKGDYNPEDQGELLDE